MKALPAKDSAAIDAVRNKVALTIASAANEHGLKLPLTIEIMDAEGEVISYEMSKYYQITPHQEFEKVLTFPFWVILSDGGPRALAILVAQPKRAQ